MGAYHVLRALLALCAIWMDFIPYIDAMICDFAGPDELLVHNALVICHMNMDDFDSASAICPHRVNETEYIWHPQSASDDHSHFNTYISEYGAFKSLALSNVFITDAPVKFVSMESHQSQTAIHFNVPIHDVFAVTDHRLIFVCGPKDLVLSAALQRRLDALDGYAETQKYPWSPATPLTEEIEKMGRTVGLGVLFLYREHLTVLLQGCGSRPSPLFDPDVEVTVDRATGTRSCVANPISRSPIGFLCEGKIEPEDCMRYLLDQNGEVVVAPEPYSYLKFYDTRWVVARYFNSLALPPFQGECRCIDSETGQVKARIEVRSKTEYICDITGKIFRNRVRPIRGHWCSVVLHPGSTLTIRFPIDSATTISGEDSDEHRQLGPPSQKRAKYLFETGFQPTDLKRMRQLKNHDGFNLYYDVSYRRIIAGDALELDVSKMSQGEVKLIYHMNEPLALRSGPNSFFYHWTLNAVSKYIFDRIRATVKVSFAFTHRYTILGCDREQRRVFNDKISRKYCSTKWMGNGVGNIYECLYQNTPQISIVGIYCSTGEELLPNNCESTAYDLNTNRIMPLPAYVRNMTPYPMQRFQVFDIAFHTTNAFSCACVCVDQRGYERSRLVLQSNDHKHYVYEILRKDAPHPILPYAVLPWREVGLWSDERSLLRSFVLYNVYTTSHILHVGKTLWLDCGVGSETPPHSAPNDVASNGRRAASWLPYYTQHFYYTVNHTASGPEIIRKTYGESIASTGGFRIVDNDPQIRSYQRMMIQSHMNAVLVSKDPVHKKFVPMTFVCGRNPDPSDLTVVSGDVSASTISHVTASSAQYASYLVQVAVEMTDPYMQGCGVTYLSTELFRPETPKLYDADGELQFGCQIDIETAKEAAFYCPAPYVLDPPNCFDQVYVNGEVKNLTEISKSLIASASSHFVTLLFDSARIGPGETLHQTPPLECRCVTIKGIVLSTIHIENYYSK
ncbi:hypothetical protein BBBOND_0405030 [Babesia bigemina]|uniref:6-Cys domain-containing protein n=1 Tax=Babesia bigemina TaxID=5866 RepID=A0A061DBS0_BABBI|nr:hypothetical protein BBBOND_0405030 [Babesia bigemina]CDR98018.1 hypothetical protein BBBOND_0405030 [Babesia bigemina]|eukprot:XP_012770204.1 hypothetical protein BBBOND_0405030 [Babesia bigemina]